MPLVRHLCCGGSYDVKAVIIRINSRSNMNRLFLIIPVLLLRWMVKLLIWGYGIFFIK